MLRERPGQPGTSSWSPTRRSTPSTRALDGRPGRHRTPRDLAARIDAAAARRHRDVRPHRRGASASPYAGRSTRRHRLDATTTGSSSTTSPQSPALHMALDEVLTERGRRRAAAADAAGLGVGRARRGHRQLPVAAQRGRPGGRRAARRHRRAADQRRRRDVRRAGQHHHVLAVRPGRPSSQGLSFADSYAYPGRLGARRRSAIMGIKAWYQPLNDIAHRRRARSRAPRRSGSPAAPARCCTT